ncbi:hypothetical protein KUCAC02_030717, partial [Chaenocephalus aceratus]
ACVCIPTYVSPSVAKARARDTDGTQMETDHRANQRYAALTQTGPASFRVHLVSQQAQREGQVAA